MSFDNRIFNVNGETFEQFEAALKLAFNLNGSNTKAASWSFTEQHGLILHWHKTAQTAIEFLIPLDAAATAVIAWQWLKGDQAKGVIANTAMNSGRLLNHDDVSMMSEDEDLDDFDGSEGAGWRMYVQSWGYVNRLSSAICAIKPVTLWYGK